MHPLTVHLVCCNFFFSPLPIDELEVMLTHVVGILYVPRLLAIDKTKLLAGTCLLAYYSGSVSYLM